MCAERASPSRLDTGPGVNLSQSMTSNPSSAGISAFTISISTRSGGPPGVVNIGMDTGPKESKIAFAKQKRLLAEVYAGMYSQSNLYAFEFLASCDGLWSADIAK